MAAIENSENTSKKLIKSSRTGRGNQESGEKQEENIADETKLGDTLTECIRQLSDLN